MIDLILLTGELTDAQGSGVYLTNVTLLLICDPRWLAVLQASASGVSEFFVQLRVSLLVILRMLLLFRSRAVGGTRLGEFYVALVIAATGGFGCFCLGCFAPNLIAPSPFYLHALGAHTLGLTWCDVTVLTGLACEVILGTGGLSFFASCWVFHNTCLL